MQEYYAAPMEGLTGWRWRQVHAALFGPADRYYTPFLSPNANFEFQTKELQEIAPENNRDLPVVPQILTNRAEYFIWAAKECQSRGYGEVNLNLGCPSGTVTGKNKGAGLLRESDLLRPLLDGIFDALPDLRISVKTRIGWDDPARWPALLDILNDYPIALLIVHPRLRTEFYKGAIHREVFAWTQENTRLPLCYNGDLFTPADVAAAPALPLMLGRGLQRDPSLLRRLRGGERATVAELQAYHDACGLPPGLQRRYADAAPYARALELPVRQLPGHGCLSPGCPQGPDALCLRPSRPGLFRPSPAVRRIKQ